MRTRAFPDRGVVAVADVCEVIPGQSPPGATYNASGIGLPFFQGKAEFGALYPTAVKWCSAPRRVAQAGDVLISIRAPVGPTNLCREPSAIGRGLAALRPHEGVPSKYLLYALRASEPELRRLAVGTTFPAIRRAQLSEHRIALATSETRDAIVEFIERNLRRVDVADAALSTATKRLGNFRAAVLSAAVSGSLVAREADLAREDGRPFEHASELLRRIRARSYMSSAPAAGARALAPGSSPAPKGWVVVTLGDLLREPLRNGHSASRTVGANGVRTLTLTAVTVGDFSERNTKLTVADPSRVRELWLCAGDILVQRSNTRELVGTARLFRGPDDFAIFPDLLIRVRVDHELLPAYVEAVLRSPAGHEYLRLRAQGTAGSMPKIDQSDVASVPIPLPPIAEQHRIVEALDTYLRVAANLDAVLAAASKRAAQLRAAILRQAFSARDLPGAA